MRTVAASVLGLVLALGAAGCGDAPRTGQRSLDAFLAKTQGRAWARRFPHRPGSLPCTVVDPNVKRRVEATCSTDLSLRQDGVVVTFTESWSHGSQARAWFVFLRRDGTVRSVKREGQAG